MKKFVAMFVAMLMVVTILPSAFAANNKTIAQKASSNFSESLKPAQESEKGTGSIEKPPVELSTGIDNVGSERIGTVVSNPLKVKGSTLYGFDCYPGKTWISFDSSDPANPTVLPASDTPFYAAEYYDGMIYAVKNISDGVYEFGKVDPETYEYTKLCDSESTQGLAMDYSTGTMYALCQNVIKTVDLNTGAYTTVAPITGMPEGNFAITFAISTAGIMYAMEIAGGGFYEIDKETGVGTLIGSTGLAPNYAQSATFDHSTQTLYWAAYSTAGTLVTVDVTTGTVTTVGAFGGGAEVTCLMTRNDNVELPDPTPVSGIEVSPTEATIPEQGRTFKLTATLLPVGVYIEDRLVTWTSSNPDAATVNDKGLVTSVNPGVATITATTHDGGFTATSVITVLSLAEMNAKLSEALNVDGGELVFQNDTEYPWEPGSDGDRFCAHSTTTGMHGTFSAVTLDLGPVIGGSTLTWDWKASCEAGWDGLVLFINGVQLTGGVFASGDVPWTTVTYTIPQSIPTCVVQWVYVKDDGGSSGSDMAWLDNISFVAAEPAPVTGVEISPKTQTILTANTFQMLYNMVPINSDNANVTWASSNTAVATIDENGIVTAVAPGETTITVTTESGHFTDTAVITVMDMPTPITHKELTYAPTEVGDLCDFVLGLGTSTYIFKPTNIGEVSTTATWAVGYSISMQDGTGAELTISGEVDTVMWVFDEDFNVLAYNDDSETGMTSYIKFIPPETGTYKILITGYGEGATGGANLNITDYDPIRVTSVELDPETMTLGLNRYGSFNAIIEPANADLQTCVWTISDPTIASINAKTGRLFGLKVGTAEITVTTDDGGFTAKATLNVAVVPNPEYDDLLYGYNLYDDAGLNPGFFKMDPADGAALDIINANQLSIFAGEYYNGLLYTYSLLDFGFFQIPFYYVIDPLTWDIQVQVDMVPNICYDMAYDYETNVMYGLTDDVEGNRILGTVDMTTGIITELGPVLTKDGESPMVLACDNGGRLFTVTDAGTLYKITDKETLEAEDVGHTGYTAKYVQSMTYDHVGQALYWANMTEEASSFLKIDKENGSCLEEGVLGSGLTEVTCLFAFANPDQVTEVPPEPVPVEGVSIMPETATLEVGKTIKLKPIFEPTNATNKKVLWHSTSDAIATVDAKGNVTAMAPGSCYVIVTTVEGGFTARALISVNAPAPGDLPEGHCRVTLEVHDVWGDGSGYQMLLDSTHSTYGSTIPAEGPLTQEGDVPQEIYDLFDYKIPETADGALATQNIVVDGIVSIIVPEGTYDFCITNPTVGQRMWIATNGRADDFVMTAGNEYIFTLRLNGTNDMCDWTNRWVGFPDPTLEYFTVTFSNFDDSLLATSIVKKGADALAPNTPIRAGYTFTGWDKTFTNVQADLTVKAVYERLENWADVNGDGETNTGDAAMILAYMAEHVELTPEQLVIADTNGDGIVNTGDAATILHVIAFGE
ncbi:MAG: Ig-like domain-containing protein [Clostridia bacterium]